MLPLLACVAADSAADSDTAPVTDSDTAPASDLCTETDALDGTLGESWWADPSGDPVLLVTADGDAYWGQDCYGGNAPGPLVVTGGAFAWAGHVSEAAGSPPAQEVTVEGCATDALMDVTIFTLGGDALWGPWRLERSATPIEYEWCD